MLPVVVELTVLLQAQVVETEMPDAFGAALAAPGDLDGDGIGDLIVGDPLGMMPCKRKLGFRSPRGRVWVLSGADGAPIAYVYGDAPGDRLGQGVCAPGDLDGDGAGDFVLIATGSEFKGGRGYVRAYSPSHIRTLWSLPVEGTSRGWYARGVSPQVCGVGDLDGDGAADLAIGSAHVEGSDKAEGAGSLRVVSGATGETLFTRGGREPRGLYGLAVARLEDLNGDGASEIAVGARWRVEILSGATGAVLRTVEAPEGWELPFASVLCTTGDLDGDGFGDLVVGGAPAYGKDRVSVVSVVTGQELSALTPRGPTNGVVLLSRPGVPGVGATGVLLGAPRRMSRGGGEMWLIDAASDTVQRRYWRNLTITEFEEIESDGGNSHYGALAASIVGDVDGDGVTDLAIGESYDDCGDCLGSVAVFSGKGGERLWVTTSTLARRAMRAAGR